MSPEMKGYFQDFIVKLLGNFSSAKVWFFILPFTVSSIYLGWIIYNHAVFMMKVLETVDKASLIIILDKMQLITDTFTAWCTFNVSLAGTIVVVRETFKVNVLKQIREAKVDGDEKAIEEIKAIKT